MLLVCGLNDVTMIKYYDVTRQSSLFYYNRNTFTVQKNIFFLQCLLVLKMY